ncbi:mycothiol synthase [Kibdelosporangium lantanae]
MDIEWRTDLTEADTERVRALLASDDVDFDPGGRHAVAGDFLGYLHVDTDGDSFGNEVAELVVHPDHRHRGIGGNLLAFLLSERGKRLRVWSHHDHPDAARLAAKHDLRRVRELHKMGMEFGPDLPEPTFREAVRLRAFVPGQDEEAVVAVNARAFSWHPEQGQLTVQDVLDTEREPWFDPAGFFLAVDAEDRLLGFHWTKVHPDGTGEVYVVGVDPDAQGGGLGKALTLAGLRYLRGLDLRKVILYVESDNAPAIAVYAKLGFTLLDVGVQYER